MRDFDCCGYATRNNLRCSDGRTILKDAFKDNDGETVPVVWNHQHNDAFNVLGHALLENKADGMYSYIKFNTDTDQGRNAKMLVKNGDVSALSIYAIGLKQRGSDVIHGAIKEVSLVLAGANPGAYIDSIIAHADGSDEEAIIYIGEECELRHAESEKEESEVEDNEKKDKKSEDEETIRGVFNTLTDKQKNLVYAFVGAALADDKDDDNDKDNDDEEDNEVKHNVFDRDERDSSGYLCHADQETILSMAKDGGSFQKALSAFADDNGLELQHDATAGGFVKTGNGNVSWLFPEYKDVRPGAPELITNDQGWISTVLNKVHKSPISRIRTRQVDIRDIDALRAKGYTKGKQKAQSGNFSLVRRTTDPQTIYVKNALHRDDILDITDFDYVKYLYDIDRMMLNEELATAIMLGDGRAEGATDKIDETHIRPIWLDDELYTMHVDLDVATARKELQGTNTSANFGENYIYAEALINTLLYAREKYKGSGTPDLYCTPHLLNVMLLARDLNGRRIYSSKAELASSLNVAEIYTVEQFDGKTRTTTVNGVEKTKKLLAIVANLADYSLGSTKGGEITHFTQFDIDFNQEKSLIETRVSGALTRVYSAIAVEEPVAADADDEEESGT